MSEETKKKGKDNRTQCYICKKRINPGETLVEIIITKSAENSFQTMYNFFKPSTDQFVCTDCLRKGIIGQPELKVVEKTDNIKRLL